MSRAPRLFRVTGGIFLLPVPLPTGKAPIGCSSNREVRRLLVIVAMGGGEGGKVAFCNRGQSNHGIVSPRSKRFLIKEEYTVSSTYRHNAKANLWL